MADPPSREEAFPAEVSQDGTVVLGESVHVVQFYEDDAFLAGCVAEFLSPIGSEGDPIVVVASRNHLDLISRRLEARCAFPEGKFPRRVVLLEASVTLSKIMVGNGVDRLLFRTVIGGILETVSGVNGSRRRPRVFGEMVDILWRAGNSEAAMQLEELWNELGRQQPFELLCAYRMDGFSDAAHEGRFSRICADHSAVIPAEKYFQDISLLARSREVSRLQQREQALVTELAYRNKLEEEQRLALQQLQRSEESLRESQDALKNSVDERERLIEGLQRTVRFSELFLGILGHDLRNPLNAIVTSASLLRRRAEDEKLTKPIGRILSSADRMARMIDQLLDFTQIRLGTGLRLDCRELNLRKVCQSVVDELEVAEAGFAAEVLFEGDPLMDGDEGRICQLVSNLAGNALHHRAPGTRVQLRIDGNHPTSLRLEFHNQGAVPAELVPVLFEPFHGNADKKSVHSSGLGLGLFVSRQIVLGHGGSIAIDSSELKGTTVLVELPRKALSGAGNRLFDLGREGNAC
ncbi:MAG: ATP-binding protein [Thermoanaerobaculia bacterium]